MIDPDSLPDRLIIAIDGPAGSGKSTIAQKLADALGAVRIDSGAMYRAVTARAIDAGIDISDQRAVVELAEKISIKLLHDPQKVIADGADLTKRIREPDVNAVVSQVSAIDGVRKAMVSLQRKIASMGRVVMEGRDIGSHVFPDADIKFYLTADEATRTQRRKQELESFGQKVTYEQVRENIANRDRMDSSRASSPLTKPDDAKEIDTTDLVIDEVLDKLIEWVVYRCGVHN